MSTKIMQQMKQHIFLIGFMGVGKSTISQELKQLFEVEEIDTDACIVQKEGRPITDIFAEDGEAYFRSVETGILNDLKSVAPAIISCGGGMVMREENVIKMKEQGKIILLMATPQTIYVRVKDSTDRPLLNGHMNVDYIRQLIEARMPKYEAAADIVIHTDGRAPAEIAKEIGDKFFLV